MPIYPTDDWLNETNRPEWCATTSAGRFTIPLVGARFDRHFHDEDEFWMISDGKAKIAVDDDERYVQAGDIVLTRAGDSHDFLEVYEEVRGFFVETGHPKIGPIVHQHASAEDAAGHDVLGLPLPEDFPVR